MSKQENPDAAPPIKPGTSAEPREPESLAPAAPATAAGPVLLENPHPVAAAPSESMVGVVTVEPGGVLQPLELEAPAAPVVAAEPSAPTLLENPREPEAAPAEGSVDVVTLEAPTPAPAPAPAPSSSVVQADVAAAPSPQQPVRVLPRRPRLRATFHYDARDELNVELTLMDDRRELIHRMSMAVTQGGAIARIFEALLGVVTSAAAAAGVFGSRER